MSDDKKSLHPLKDVPVPMQIPTLSDDDSAHQVRPVSAVGAEPDVVSQTVLVRLFDPGNQLPFAFALSLSAAAQLSRLLERAVQDQLYPDEDNQKKESQS